MKTIGLTVCFVIWCLATLILGISVVGWLVFIREDRTCKNWQGEAGEASWLKIGKRLIIEITR